MNLFSATARLAALCVAAVLCFMPYSPVWAQAPKERVTIRYGYLPIPVVPMFAAKAHGLLEKEGIDLQLVKFTSGPAEFQALQSGSIDTAQGSLPAFYMGSTRGLSATWVHSFGDYGPLEALVVPAGSPVRQLKDLRGKKVAAPSGTILNMAHLYALQQAGLATSDVTFVPLQPPQALAAVLKGDVDAAWLWEPFISNVVDKGGRVLASNKSLGLLSPFGIAVNTKWLQDPKNRDALGRMLRAFEAGRRLFEKEKGPTLAEVRSVTGIDMDLAAKIISGVDWYTAADQVRPASPVSLADPKNLKSGAALLLRKYEDLAVSGKMIENRGSIETFLDPRPAQISNEE